MKQNDFYGFFVLWFMMLFFMKMVYEHIEATKNHNSHVIPAPILHDSATAEESLAAYRQWNARLAQFSNPTSWSASWKTRSTHWYDEKGQSVMATLNYFQDKLASVSIRQDSSTPPSHVTYHFYEDVMYQTDLLIGEVHLSNKGEKWVRFNQTHGTYWFDKKGQIIQSDIIVPFSAERLPLRYEQCAVCLKEAQIILTNFPTTWSSTALSRLPTLKLPENVE